MKISCFCQSYKDREVSYLSANLQATLTGNQSAFIVASATEMKEKWSY